MTEIYTTVIQYDVRKEAVTQNADRVRTLVTEIDAIKPEGLGYLALRLNDGAFLHIAAIRTPQARDALHGLPAFKAWASALADIRLGEMIFTDVDLIGVAGRDALTPLLGTLDKVGAS